MLTYGSMSFVHSCGIWGSRSERRGVIIFTIRPVSSIYSICSLARMGTPEEALANVRIVIQEWIETAKEEGRGIPQPLTVEEFARVQNQSNDLLQKYVQNEVQKAVSAVLSELAKSHQPQLAWGNRADLVATSVGGIVGYSSFLVPHGSR
jgi:hypothetical protein